MMTVGGLWLRKVVVVQVLTTSATAARRPAMPPIVIAAALTIAAAVAGIGWLVLAPRDRTRDEILANATHGLEPATRPRTVNPIAGLPPTWPAGSRRPGSLAQTGPPAGPGRPSAGLDGEPHPAGQARSASARRRRLGLLFVSADPTAGRILTGRRSSSWSASSSLTCCCSARARNARQRSGSNFPTPSTR